MKTPSLRGSKSIKSRLFVSRWHGVENEKALVDEVAKVSKVPESIQEVPFDTFATSTTIAFPENIPEQALPAASLTDAVEGALVDVRATPDTRASPWLGYQWPKVETPLSFPLDEQPKGKGALMEVYAPWGTLLSGGPVVVLAVRDDGLGREYLWYDHKEERQRWHAASLCCALPTDETRMPTAEHSCSTAI